MKELDLLKKDWKKSEATFEQLSEKDIYLMIHKKSSSIVKWILIVSILEFVVLNGISLFLPDDNSKTYEKLDNFLEIVTILNYFVSLYFVYLFYKNYKSISVINSTKKLAESIIKTRKTVQFYIKYNIIYVILFVLIISINLIYTDIIIRNYNPIKVLEILGILFFVMIFIGLFVWGFYLLLYGFLLKKLQKNYQELQKIES